MVKPIPDGYHSVTPTLTIRGASDAIEFYKKAFDAKEVYRFPGPDSKSIMHAEIRIGDSAIMLCDEMPEMGCLSPKSTGGPSGAIYLYVDDADSVFSKAVSVGAQSMLPLMDGFWGDRIGMLVDPFGHRWTVATRKKEMSLEEIQKAGAEFMKGNLK
ncbi:VOC family protein [Nitrosarchaeum sp. AC2]|uniref:VOC family protein n=1 Tax=Nitrosarchaeum sp. AC2 TaxID=2259673 RepID=UPI0015CB85F4|nr:VOC family protein [Nitrosarchaeum sp. AC2]QLH11101.1 VOC family protein [Nitrosarchaeum sp. AC2]